MTGDSHRLVLACGSVFGLCICSKCNCFHLRDLSEGELWREERKTLEKLLRLLRGV